MRRVTSLTALLPISILARLLPTAASGVEKALFKIRPGRVQHAIQALGNIFTYYVYVFRNSALPKQDAQGWQRKV